MALGQHIALVGDAAHRGEARVGGPVVLDQRLEGEPLREEGADDLAETVVQQ